MLIKAVSVNIDIEYRDICCQNIEYRIEIEKAYRPITNENFATSTPNYCSVHKNKKQREE
jgi:hypothetical protein